MSKQNSKPIMRYVKKTAKYPRSGFAPGGFTIADVLECGHKVYTKGSSGYAVRRKCHECAFLAAGGQTRTGNILETWDKNRQWPVTEVLRQVKDEKNRFKFYHRGSDVQEVG